MDLEYEMIVPKDARKKKEMDQLTVLARVVELAGLS
jgi:hypothetical protein